MSQPTTILSTKKVALGQCSESHGSEKVHTSQACSFCEKRVCQMHFLAHVSSHFQRFYDSLKQIGANTQDAVTKSYVEQVLAKK